MNRKTIRREDAPSPSSSSSSPTTDSKDTEEWFVCMYCKSSSSRRAFRLGKDLIFHKKTVHPKQFKLQRRTRRKLRRVEEQSGTLNKPNSRSQGHEESLSASAPKNCSSFKLVAGKMGGTSKRGKTTSTDASLIVASHNAAAASGISLEADKLEACAKSNVTTTYNISTKSPPIGIATRIRMPTQNNYESTEARSKFAVSAVASIDKIQGGGIATSTRVSATAGADWEETNKIKQSTLTDPSRICIYCRKCFANIQSVVRHMRLHTEKESFQCSECPEKFSRHDARNVHELSRHQKGISSASEPPSDKINGLNPTGKELTCEFCPQTFSNEQSLNEHDATHVKFARIKIKRLRLDQGLGVHRVRKERMQLGELEQKDNNESQPKSGRMMDSKVNNDIITTDFQHQAPCLQYINSNYHDCNYCEKVFSSQTFLYQHEAKVHLNVLH